MKKFSFHLQKVLELKEKETEQAKWAFGKSVQRKLEEETKMYQLAERREEITVFLHEMQHQPCSAAQLNEITRYRQSIDRAMMTQQKTIHGCEQEMERCKSHLTNRMQESQVWQRLRQKAEDEFIGAVKLREQKELDEIGSSRYLRSSR